MFFKKQKNRIKVIKIYLKRKKNFVVDKSQIDKNKYFIASYFTSGNHKIPWRN